MQTRTRDSVMDYLQADHRRLDGLMEECKSQMETGDTTGAAGTFASFREGLDRHIRIEEEMVFPEFEAASGLGPAGGPTGVMRYEHAEIRRLLEAVHDLLTGAAPSAAEFEQLTGSLVALLHEHNQKEERILYPTTDQMLPLQRLGSLCAKMREFE